MAPIIRSDPTLAVLGFHKIGTPLAAACNPWFYISPDAFAATLRWLQNSRWCVVDAQAVLAGLMSPTTLPKYSALLTFDDGYRSMRETALPILRSFGMPAVLFVPTGCIGGSNSFDDGVEPRETICDWEDLSALENQGVSTQSHSVSHRRFSTLTASEREIELIDSKALIEQRLGKRVEMFAYPYGDAGGDGAASADEVRNAGYSAGCLYGGGPNPLPIANAFRIERVAMGPDTELARVLDGAP